jgi:hypothetical protein
LCPVIAPRSALYRGGLRSFVETSARLAIGRVASSDRSTHPSQRTAGERDVSARVAFVASHPLTLNLDIDVVRSLLGRWADQPTEAGMQARKMAVSVARTVLEGGRDVIIAQLLARPDVLSEFEGLARDPRLVQG